MNNTVATTPPPTAKGCCGVGCLTLFALLAFLAFAFIGGGFWALNHLRHTYSSDEPAAIPTLEPSTPAATEEQTRSTPLEAAPEAAPTSPSSTGIATPLPGTTTAPTPLATPVNTLPAEARWKAFERAAKRGEKASIALSAAEINQLIANDPDWRGKVFVSIQNNAARVQASIPLKDVALMSGRYLNGEATVQASPDGDPYKAQITNVILANQAVPEGVLESRVFGWSSVHGMAQKWLNEQNIAVFRIENDRVIGETR